MSWIVKFLFPAKAYTPSGSIVLLLARIIFGVLLMSHGIAKLKGFDMMVDSFPDPLGIGHRTSLMLAIFAELICSIGFITGTLYRLALIPMIFTMCIAFFVIHRADPFAAKELAFSYMAVFALLYIAGQGDYSIDSLISKRLHR